MKKAVFLIIPLAVVAMILASGCARLAPTTTTPSPQQLPIGVATPLTGPSGFLGTQISDAIQMVIDDQNAQGGVTIAGQKYVLKPIVLDTKADVVLGKSVAEQLIFTDDVRIIAGPFIGDAAGVQVVTEPNKVLAFFVNFNTPSMTGPKKPFSFSCSFPIPQATYKPLDYIHKFYPQAKNVYSIENDIPVAPTFAAGTQNGGSLLGFNYLGYEKTPGDTKDFTPLIARVLTHKPDVIDCGATGGSMGVLAALMIKQIREAGFSGPLMMPAAPPEEVLEESVPAQSLNNMISNYISIDGPVVDPKYRDVCQRFQAKYQQAPLGIVPDYYNDMMALFQFLNTQNTMDTTAWMQGFGNYHWQGLMGFESSWIAQPGDGINRRSLDDNWVTHYENGKPITDYTVSLPSSMFVQQPQ